MVVERDGDGKGRAWCGGVTWRRGGVVSRRGRVLTRRSGGGKGRWWWKGVVGRDVTDDGVDGQW